MANSIDRTFCYFSLNSRHEPLASVTCKQSGTNNRLEMALLHNTIGQRFRIERGL